MNIMEEKRSKCYEDTINKQPSETAKISVIYSFKEKIFIEGNRRFIKIPLNVWEETGQKGLIPVRVLAVECTFECKLIPKGNGIYYIPITKNFIKSIDITDEISISFEIISGLTRINHDSPYTKENPIRKIDCIESIISLF